MPEIPSALIIAAPASGSGKTAVTLALLRCLKDRGVAVSSFKVGPDYIDPAFHTAASGRPCINVDPWAMRPDTIGMAIESLAADASIIIGEGVMGLFDGATHDRGSTADLAAALDWPVLLVIDASAQAASAAALLHGFATFRDDVRIAGVIFNRVGSEAHARVLEEACASLPTEVLGSIPRDTAFDLPERHLGLVQAREHKELETFLDGAARHFAAHVDLAAVRDAATPSTARESIVPASPPVPPPGQRIAVAQDDAFAFIYNHIVEGWRRNGAEVRFFSPLADEGPQADADAVFLPGGYPELFADRLSAAAHFLEGLRAAAGRGACVYGECGGYMVLGTTLTDADGATRPMAGLLPVETSFAERRLHLGYRQVSLAAEGWLGSVGARFRGHEFHYARVVREEGAPPAFRCADARGVDLGVTGLQRGRVLGSFLHLIDRVN